ncbi:RNA-guided endonuclease TnpB family protein [Streptomyces sp. NPDC094472]
MLRDHCSLYNGALQERRDAYRHTSRTSIKYGDQSAQLKEIRAVAPQRQGHWSFSSRQATIRRLDKAFQAFFRRVKAGQKPGEAQRHLATFPKRTRRRTEAHRAAARRVAKLYARIRRRRPDHAHKTALTLVRDHDVIAHEKLDTAGMTRAPKPEPDPDAPGTFLPNGAAAKAGLNRGILDAGWAQFLTILAKKAESAGRLVVAVDARNTSRTCPPSLGGCRHAAEENRVNQAKFACTACGFTAHADHVGATNVLDRAGLVLCDAA